MKRYKFFAYVVMAFFTITLFSACNKSNTEGRYIPMDAVFAVVMNSETVTTKLPWDEIKNGEMFKEFMGDSNTTALMRTAMENPANTGIDMKKDVTFFVQKDSLGGYLAVQGGIADAAKFKEYYTKLAEGAVATEKDGLSSLKIKEGVVSWNKDKYVVVMDLPDMKQMNGRGSYDDVADNASKRDVLTEAAGVFNMKEDKSLAKNSKFSELMGQKGDLHFWFNGESLGSAYSGMAGMAALGALNLTKLSEGSIATGVVNFEDGKITMDTKSYSGEELSKLWKKYEGKAFSSDMAERSPIKDVAATFALNFKPEGLKEFIKLLGVEGFANMGASQLGFNVDDFLKANKGDIFFSLGDFKNDSMGKNEPTGIFAVSIGDKTSFQKIVNAGQKAGGGAQDDIFYNMNDDVFAIGNNKVGVDSYISGKTKNNFDYLKNITGSPSGGYVNFQYLLKNVDANDTDSIAIAQRTASLAMFENLLFKGGEFKDGGMVQHLTLNLMDKKTNSLKQLNAYANKMAKLEEEQRKRYSTTTWDPMVEEPMVADSAMMIEPQTVAPPAIVEPRVKY